jgi:PAS domain S-box-containing protein
MTTLGHVAGQKHLSRNNRRVAKITANERRISEQNERLQGVAARLAADLTPTNVVTTIIEAGLSALGSNAGSLVQPDGDDLVVVGTIGYSKEIIEPFRRFPLSYNTPMSRAMQTMQPVWLESPEQFAQQFGRLPNAAALAMSQAWGALPLIASGKVIGVLGISYPTAQSFDAEIRRFAEKLATLCAQALERSLLYERERRARQALEEANERLMSSEERFRLLTEYSAHIIWRAQPDGGFIDQQESWERFTGQNYAAYADGGSLAAVHPEDRQKVAMAWREAIVKQVPFEASYRLRHRDGEYRHVLTRGIPRYDAEHATVQEWVGYTEDVTERRAAEAALRLTQSQLSAFMEHSPGSMFIKDSAGRYVIVNRAFLTSSGKTSAEVIGKTDHELFAPELAERFVLEDKAVLAGGQSMRFEDSFSYDGQQFTFLSHKFPLPDGLIGCIGADITERKQAEEALRRSEERYRNLIESTDKGFCVIEIIYDADEQPVDYRFLETNAIFEQHTGLRDAIGKTARELVPNLEHEWVAIYAQVAKSGKPLRFEQHSAAMGRWFSVDAAAVDGKHSNKVALLFSNITEQVQAEMDAQFLMEAIERVRVAQDADTLIGEIAQMTGQHLRVARCYVAEIDEPGQRWSVHQDYHGALPSLAGSYPLTGFPTEPARLLRTGQRVVTEDLSQDPDFAHLAEQAYEATGNRAHVIIPYLRDGNWVSCFVVLSATPRVWLPREMRLLETIAERLWNAVEKLRLEKAQRDYIMRLQKLSVAGLQINVASTQADLVRLVEEQARVLIGVEHAAILLDPIDDQATAAAQPAADMSLPLTDGDGKRFGVLQLWAPAPGIFSDFDKGMAQQLAHLASVALKNQTIYAQEQAARAQAEEASRLKDEFLATVSHELRTPLTAFLGYAQMLQIRKRDEAYLARTIEKMVRSAKAQAQLIEDLLDIGRIVSGRLRIEPTLLDLSTIVLAAIDTVRPTVEAKGLNLRLELQPGEDRVIGDASRLQQVAWNLLSNATKFTPMGGTITVRLASSGRHMQLTVSDNGKGIEPAFLPYVFDRFRQADGTTNRMFGGLGLGLAIVRHLVELHGGTVQVSSAGEGLGATFTVRLPLAQKQPQLHIDTATTQVAPPIDCPAALAGLRVLVVDDQPDLLELIEEILIVCGSEVRTVQNARAALALMADWRPDVLVSDIAMPDEDGYWLIDHVRALPAAAGGNVPALALTAYVRLEDRLRVLAAGFEQYVPKPIEPGELRSVVAQLARQANNE